MATSKKDALREALARLAHDQWTGWMVYLFDKSIEVGDDCVEIPAAMVTRWQRQVSQLYEELPENEKDSDRKEADRVLALLEAYGIRFD